MSNKEKKIIQENLMLNYKECIDHRDKIITVLETKLEEIKSSEKEHILRAKAELENIIRRTELDIEKIYKFSLEKFSYDILPVIDNLERALELSDKNNQEIAAMLEGVELTLKSLLDVISKYGINTISDVNIPFNPELHQAMSIIESNDHKKNYVLVIMQKGYTLNGRLLRPAMVAVSK